VTHARTAAKPLGLVALLCATLAGCRGSNADLPEPGTEFFAIAPDAVTEVVYSSGSHKLYAYRWRSGEPFQILVARRGAPPEQCTAGEGFGRWLRALARVQVQRELTPKIDEARGEWAEVRIRDDSRVGPADLTLHVPAATGAVVLAHREHQYVVDVDASALHAVALGCGGLGAGK
jgi:hypothetical protein